MRTLKKLLVASLLFVSSLAHGAVVIARPVIISRPPVISRPAVVSAPKPAAVAKPVTLPASSKQKSSSVPVLTPPVVIPRSPPSLDDCEKKAVWC